MNAEKKNQDWRPSSYLQYPKRTLGKEMRADPCWIPAFCTWTLQLSVLYCTLLKYNQPDTWFTLPSQSGVKESATLEVNFLRKYIQIANMKLRIKDLPPEICLSHKTIFLRLKEKHSALKICNIFWQWYEEIKKNQIWKSIMLW